MEGAILFASWAETRTLQRQITLINLHSPDETPGLGLSSIDLLP